LGTGKNCWYLLSKKAILRTQPLGIDTLKGEQLFHNYVFFFIKNALHSKNKKNIFFYFSENHFRMDGGFFFITKRVQNNDKFNKKREIEP